MAIELIDKIKPKNGGSFPMVDAEDVLMPDGTRLSEQQLGGITEVNWDDVNHKPFTETTINTEVFAEQTLTFADDAEGRPVHAFDTPPFTLSADEKYQVEWDGQAYTVYTDYLNGITFMGDPDVSDPVDDTAAPFLVEYEDGLLQMVGRLGETSHTVQITRIDTTYKIKEECLPEDFGGSTQDNNIVVVTAGEDGDIASHSYFDIADLVDAGKSVVVSCKGNIFVFAGLDTSNEEAYFDRRVVDGQDLYVYRYAIRDDGSWEQVFCDHFQLNSNSIGGPAYFITTYTTTDGQTYTADHTFAEQMAAFQSGQIIYALYEGAVVPILGGDSSAIQYSLTMAIDGGFITGMILHLADDTIALVMSEQQGLPQVTTADNGKILQVVEGVWASVSVADSAVAAYVDDYINTALGGDY